MEVIKGKVQVVRRDSGITSLGSSVGGDGGVRWVRRSGMSGSAERKANLVVMSSRNSFVMCRFLLTSFFRRVSPPVNSKCRGDAVLPFVRWNQMLFIIALSSLYRCCVDFCVAATGLLAEKVVTLSHRRQNTFSFPPLLFIGAIFLR